MYKPGVRTRQLTLIAVNAALYAIGSYATSYIEPLGIGQFRPAIVIPLYFAIAYGPVVGGLGAALGTFIASIMRYGTPLLTLVSGTPANLAGFYLVGYLLNKRFTWSRFLVTSLLGLLVGNLIAAVGVLGAAHLGLYPPIADLARIPLAAQIAFATALIVFWMATMAPFAITLTPLLLRATLNKLPPGVREGVAAPYDEGRSLLLTLLAVGALSILLGLLATLSPALFNVGRLNIAGLVSWVFTVIGTGLIAVGVVVAIRVKPSS